MTCRAHPLFHPVALAAIALATVLAAASPAGAQWSATGDPVCTAATDQSSITMVSDQHGGAIMVWADGRGTYNIYAQRIDSTGVALWTPDGVPVCSAIGAQAAPLAISDRRGGVLVVWNDSRDGSNNIYGQRIDSDGVPQWVANGVSLSNAGDGRSVESLISDGVSGNTIFTSPGAIAGWVDFRDYSSSGLDIYVQHIDGDGVGLWNSSGVLLCDAVGDQNDLVMVGDGSGGLNFASGAYAAWTDMRSGTRHLYARRVNASGVPQWAANGVAVCTADGNQSNPQICNTGNAFIVWGDSRGGAFNIYAQELDSNGNAVWSADGVPVCNAADEQLQPRVVSIGGGSTIVSWIDRRNGNSDIYAQRMDSNGVPAWGGNGLPICDATGDQSEHVMVSDGSGGAIVCWLDHRLGNVDVYAQRVDINGNVVWQPNGIRMTETPPMKEGPTLIPDATHGAIAAWPEKRLTWDIFANRVSGAYGTLDAPARTAAGFSLAIRSSNPAAGAARFALELPRSGPARADVFDLAGRRVRTLLDDPALAAGSHVVSWDGHDASGAAAHAGIYFVIARSGSESRVTKLVEVR